VGLVLKYIQPTKSGSRYRRRIPEHLREIIGKREITKALGRTYDEALKAYPAVHADAVRQIDLAQRQYDSQNPLTLGQALTELENYQRRIDMLKRFGFGPHDATVDPHDPESVAEGEARSQAADEILGKYPIDKSTGHPRDVSLDDLFMVRALNAGAPPKPAATLLDAKNLYLKERLKGSEHDREKNRQRIERIYDRTVEALGDIPKVADIDRGAAKRVKDHLLALGTLKPASVKRELNIIKAMVNHAVREGLVGPIANPFASLDFGEEIPEAESQRRDPLPDEVLDKVRLLMQDVRIPSIGLIWRLLEGTGCRLAEITGLRVEDVDVSSELPHIRVRWHEDRRIKTRTSVRHVPLVGDALEAAKLALELADKGQAALFPRYFGGKGPTAASQVLMNRVRQVTKDRRHVVHSLRHNMKDRLWLAEVSQLDQNLILGHSLGGVGDRTYGGDPAKLRVTTRAMKKAFGLSD
jgi:integrase